MFQFRYADDSFTSAFVSTVGIDFKVKTVVRNNKRVKLQIWVRLLEILIVFANLSLKRIRPVRRDTGQLQRLITGVQWVLS